MRHVGGDPKLKKKFLLTKPTYRPNHIGAKRGIACQLPPPHPPPGSRRHPSSLTASGHDPPPPPVQCRNGAKIALLAAAHRHKSGAKIYFDCRCTTAHHQDRRHTSSHAAAIVALAPAPRPSSRRPAPSLPLFFVFSPPVKRKKPLKVPYITTIPHRRLFCWLKDCESLLYFLFLSPF